MLISDAWVALAHTHALELATPRDSGADIALAGPGFTRADYGVIPLRALHPSRVHRYAPRPDGVRPLVVTGSASDLALAVAVTEGVSVLVVSEHGPVRGVLLDSADRRLFVDAPPPGTKPAAVTERPARGRPAWGTCELAIELLRSREARTQRDLAERSRLTQGRVSQALSSWDWVARTSGGWVAVEPERGADWLARTYRQPRTSASFLALDAPVAAARTIAAALERAEVRYAITGQVAADFSAPWVRPDHATIWTDRLVDLSAVGCAPTTAAEATVTLAVPDDPYALDAAVETDGVMLTDPWRTWLQLAQNGEAQAADHLRERLLRA
jgi:hypothetical protein